MKSAKDRSLDSLTIIYTSSSLTLGRMNSRGSNFVITTVAIFGILYIMLRKKAIEPLGEAKSDVEFWS